MTGIEMIAEERARQVAVEGWSPEHDKQHTSGELAWAAVCYAAPAPIFIQMRGPLRVAFVDPWPSEWASRWDKRPKKAGSYALAEPTEAERLRMLIKAGALIAAEIDRLTERHNAVVNGG